MFLLFEIEIAEIVESNLQLEIIDPLFRSLPLLYYDPEKLAENM